MMRQPKKSALRDQLALAADEIIRRGELLDGLSNGSKFTDCAGLLGLGFVVGVIACGLGVAAVGVFW